MRHIIKAVLLVSVIAISAVTEAKTVGIWEDHRSYIKPELTNILAKAGWDVMFFKNRGRDGNDLENAERLAKTDVMLFCGGWNAYFFPTQKSRLNIIRYVASGKGVLLSGFRSGYVRTANRPMFPSIGCTYNRLSSPWIGPAGDNFLSDCFGGKMIAAGGNDHLVIRVGEKGTPFCGSGDDIVGAYGDYFNGKVIVFGGHFMFSNDKSEAEQILEKLLMKSLKYLSSGKMLSEEDSAFVIRQAESEFLRREIMITWAQDERGPDRRPGYIPQTRDEITSHPEALSCQLDYLISHLPLSSTPKERGISARLKSGVKIVKDKSNKLIESIKKKISSYSPTDLVLMYESNNGQLVDRKKLKDDWSRYIRVQDIEDAKKAIAALQKEVEAIKKAKLKKEIESDLKKVPSIVAKFADADPEIRFNAVLEIGRISPEDAEVAKEVVKLISDADEKVRTQAIITLGWMRSKDAVDPLIKLLSTDDVFDKRRAIQSLGHIGDKKAVAPLMKIVQDKNLDYRTLSVAAIALGHLKAKEAVPLLLTVAEDPSLKGWDSKQIKVSAILALGYIGDKSVKESLQNLHKNAKDFPKDRRGSAPASNYLSTQSHLGVYTATQLALQCIEEGGRKTVGVVQPEEYRSHDVFYAIKKKHNAFIGRTETVRGAFVGPNQKYLWPLAKKSGFTGVHNAWGWRSGWTPEDFKEVVRKAGEAGLIWIDVMPGWGMCDTPGCEMLFWQFDDILCFRGLWAEETWPEVGSTPAKFFEYVEKKYGKNWKVDLQLTDAELKALETLPPWMGFGMPGPDKKLEAGFLPPWDGTLRTLCLEFAGKSLDDAWRESQDYMSSRRKGFSHTYVVSTADPSKVLGGIKAAHRLDSFGHESYECFGRSSAYFMERYRNAGAPRSVMTEQYNWYCPSNAHAVRGFWQNAIHSKCYYNFALHHIFEQPSWYDNWSWERGRWEKANEVFTRVAKTPEHYDISESASNVGVILSERSSVVTKEQVYFQVSIPVRTDQSSCASWTALNQLQVPSDIVWAETLTEKLLAKYKFIYLPSSRFLTDNEAKLLRSFVEKGGILFAEGASTLFHPLKLKNRGNYALSDVFGCNWKETRYRQGDDADTLAVRHGSAVSAYKVHPNSNLVNIDDTIHRDSKPTKSIVNAKMTGSLATLEAGEDIEMDAALGIDIVVPTTAKVIAKYNDFNKAPAVLVNEFGKGRCYFVTAHNFSLASTTSQWEMMPNKFVFWKNVKELVGAALQDGFNHIKADLPVKVEGVSQEVEVSVADFGNRYVVHILDYDVTSKGVTNAVATIPGERKIKRVYYPFAAKPTNLKLEGRTVKLRNFEVYDMFVVEFE